MSRLIEVPYSELHPFLRALSEAGMSTEMAAFFRKPGNATLLVGEAGKLMAQGLAKTDPNQPPVLGDYPFDLRELDPGKLIRLLANNLANWGSTSCALNDQLYALQGTYPGPAESPKQAVIPVVYSRRPPDIFEALLRMLVARYQQHYDVSGLFGLYRAEIDPEFTRLHSNGPRRHIFGPHQESGEVWTVHAGRSPYSSQDGPPAFDFTAMHLSGASYPAGPCARWETIDFGIPYHERDEINTERTRVKTIFSVPPQEWPHIGVMTFLALFPEWLRQMDGARVPCLRVPAVRSFGTKTEPSSWDEVNQREALAFRSHGGSLQVSLGRLSGEKHLGFYGQYAPFMSGLTHILPRLVAHT